MKKVKVLWISASVPCKKIPHAGGQTFRFYFNEFLNDSRFDIYLIAFNDGMPKSMIDSELKDVGHDIVYKSKNSLKKLVNIESAVNPWNRHAGIVSNYYYLKTMKYVKAYKNCGNIPDVIILEWTGIVLLAPELRKIFPQTKLVASEHDVTYVGWKRKYEFYSGLKKVLWSIKFNQEHKLELHALSLCDLVLPHNPDNCKLIENEGISSDKIRWLPPYFNSLCNIKRAQIEPIILFFGAMGRQENSLSALWFIDKVLPRLTDLPVKFVVLGGSPPEELKNREGKNIHITGFVDDIRPYFESAMCFVAPLILGAGIKVKVLEALSSGIPVLTNKIGIEGIPAHDGCEYLHCETAEEYETSIRLIYENEIDVKQIEVSAKKFMEKYSTTNSSQEYRNLVYKIGEDK